LELHLLKFQLGWKYYNGNGIIALRTNIDLTFSEHFAVRISSNLYQFSIGNTITKVKNATQESRNVSITNDVRTIFQPSAGFYFTF
jgi:hypothetical protein